MMAALPVHPVAAQAPYGLERETETFLDEAEGHGEVCRDDGYKRLADGPLAADGPAFFGYLGELRSAWRFV